MKLLEELLNLAEATQKLDSIEDMIKLFSTINVDCKKSGEQVVKLTNTDYYGGFQNSQIANIYEIPEEDADELAKKMAAEVKKQVKAGKMASEYGLYMDTRGKILPNAEELGYMPETKRKK